MYFPYGSGIPPCRFFPWIWQFSTCFPGRMLSHIVLSFSGVTPRFPVSLPRTLLLPEFSLKRKFLAVWISCVIWPARTPIRPRPDERLRWYYRPLWAAGMLIIGQPASACALDAHSQRNADCTPMYPECILVLLSKGAAR